MTLHSNHEPPPEAWGIAPGARVWIGGHDRATRRAVEKLLADTVRPPTGPIDAAFICPDTLEEAVYFAEKLRRRLGPSGVVWIVRPRGSEPAANADGPAYDLLCAACRGEGWEEVARAPVGATLLAVGFRWRRD